MRSSRDSSGFLVLQLTDDGVGLPESFNPDQDGGLGLQLTRSLARQVRGGLIFTSTPIGLRVELRVPPRPGGAATP